MYLNPQIFVRLRAFVSRDFCITELSVQSSLCVRFKHVTLVIARMSDVVLLTADVNPSITDDNPIEGRVGKYHDTLENIKISKI
jgi:hypothetical protein